MKKLLAILLAAILCVGLMAGCGQTTIIVNMGGEDEAEALLREKPTAFVLVLAGKKEQGTEAPPPRGLPS